VEQAPDELNNFPMRVFGEGEFATTNLKDAAAYLGVHENTLRRWADKGLIPVIKLPTGVRRYILSGIIQMHEQMYAAFEDTTAEEVTPTASMARALLEESSLRFSDEVSSILEGLASGKSASEIAQELKVEEDKIGQILNVSSRLLDRLPPKRP
jgi:excisionase family DNA binding protein